MAIPSFIILIGVQLIVCNNIIRQSAEVWPDEINVNPLASRTIDQLFHLEPQVTMNTSELIWHYGYLSETHTVETSDGYILQMQRIPHGNIRSRYANTTPVLLVHGSFMMADIYLLQPPNKNLAFLLADNGFDVWLANLRGTTNSNTHKTLDPQSAEYWEFSWDEMALYDLPAMIDYILMETKLNQMYYSGHSLGGGIVFPFLATHPEYNSKVKAVFATAPISNFINVHPVLKLAAKLEPVLRPLAKAIGFYNSPPLNQHAVTIFLGLLGKHIQHVFQLIMLVLFGEVDKQISANLIPIFLAHASSMSFNALMQMAQTINTHRIRHYDWGQGTNLKKYGQETPPEYDLSSVAVKIHLYYGGIDAIISKESVIFLSEIMPNVASVQEVGSRWNHEDFQLSNNAAENYYKKIIQIMNKDRFTDFNTSAMTLRCPYMHRLKLLDY